jgi:protein MYSM1
MSGSLSLIPCKEFTGVAGAVFSQAQPYSVEISEEAMILMDFHAHLSCYEVIGYLGGDWNARERKLTIRRAFPCKGLEGTQQTDSCEMDPAAEIEAKDKMDEWGLQAVGWYHSHPTFKPNPSEKDIENQENYQTLFHDEDSKSEPFVAMIFSPYDLRLPNKESRTEMFWVAKSQKFGPMPMHMRHSRKRLEAVPTLDTKQSMIDLIDKVDALGRIQLTELWRPFTRILDGKTPEGGPCTKLAKLRGALAAYLPETDESEDFFDELFTEIQSKWKVDLGY